MKILVEDNEKESLGYLLKTINNSRLLDESGQALRGRDIIAVNRHLGAVLSLYNKMNDATKGGLQTSKKKIPKVKKVKEDGPKP